MSEQKIQCSKCGRTNNAFHMKVEELHACNETIKTKTGGLVEMATTQTLKLVAVCKKCLKSVSGKTHFYLHTLQHLESCREDAQAQNEGAPFYWNVTKTEAPTHVRNHVPNIKMMRRVLELQDNQPITASQFASLVFTRDECITRFGSALQACYWIEQIRKDNEQRSDEQPEFPTEWEQEFMAAPQVQQEVQVQPAQPAQRQELWFPPISELPPALKKKPIDQLLAYASTDKTAIELRFGRATAEATFRRQHKSLNPSLYAEQGESLVPSFRYVRGQLGLEQQQPLSLDQLKMFAKTKNELTAEDQKHRWFPLEKTWDIVQNDNQNRARQHEQAEQRKEEKRLAEKPWYPHLSFILQQLGTKGQKKVNFVHVMHFGLPFDQATEAYGNDVIDGRALQAQISEHNTALRDQKRQQRSRPNTQEQLAEMTF